MNSILSNSIYRRLLWLKCLIWCQSKHSHTIRFNISVAVACMCELKEGDEKKTNKWTVKSDSIGNWRKLINMERIQTEKEWKGANELSGWSQDNRNYNSSPPKRDSDDYSEKKKHVIIILSSGSTKFGTLLFGYWTNGNWKSISRLFVSLFNLCARLVSFSTCIKAYSSDAIIKINRLFNTWKIENFLFIFLV